MSKWKIVDSYQDSFDWLASTRTWVVESGGEVRKVLTNSWEDEDRVGEKIAEGRFEPKA